MEFVAQLSEAVRRGKVHAVEELIAAGAYVDAGDASGKVALEYASQAWVSSSGDQAAYRVIKLLLDAGSKPRGDVLSFAMNSRDPILILELLDRGLLDDIQKAAIINKTHAEYKYAEPATRQAVEAWLLGERRGTDVECVVCLKVFETSGRGRRDPAVLVDCGHTVCALCARALYDTSKTCPTCNVRVVTNPMVNYSLRTTLAALSSEEVSFFGNCTADISCQILFTI